MRLNVWPNPKSGNRHNIGVPKHISKLLMSKNYGGIWLSC